MAASKKAESSPPPDRTQLEDAIRKIRNNIESIQKKLNATAFGSDAAADKKRDERRALQSDLEKFKADIETRKQEQAKLKQQIGDIDASRKQLRQKQNEMSKNAPTSLKDIEERLRQVENRLETGGGSSLKREKVLMGRIKELENAKRNFKQQEDLGSIVKSREQERKNLVDQIQRLQEEIEEIRVKRDARFATLQEIVQSESSAREKKNAQMQERQGMRDEIRKCNSEIAALRERFDKEMEEWRRKREEEREKERLKREAERRAAEERRQKLAEERRQRDEEREKTRKEQARLKKLNPKEDQISSCEILIAYLVGEQTAEKDKERQRAVRQFNADDFAKPGMQAFKRSEEEWITRPKKAKPQPQAKPQAETQEAAKPKADRKLPALSVSKLQAFDLVGVRPPTKQSEVATTVEELKKRKTYFEGFKKTMAQVEAEEKEEEEREQREREKRLQAQRERAERDAAAKAQAVEKEAEPEEAAEAEEDAPQEEEAQEEAEPEEEAPQEDAEEAQPEAEEDEQRLQEEAEAEAAENARQLQEEAALAEAEANLRAEAAEEAEEAAEEENEAAGEEEAAEEEAEEEPQQTAEEDAEE